MDPNADLREAFDLEFHGLPPYLVSAIHKRLDIDIPEADYARLSSSAAPAPIWRSESRLPIGTFDATMGREEGSLSPPPGWPHLGEFAPGHVTIPAHHEHIRPLFLSGSESCCPNASRRVRRNYGMGCHNAVPCQMVGNGRQLRHRFADGHDGDTASRRKERQACRHRPDSLGQPFQPKRIFSRPRQGLLVPQTA